MKILINGGYGCYNLGDDAQLQNNCDFFKKNGFNDVKIISPRPYIEEICGYPFVQDFRKDFKKDSNEKMLNRFYEILDLKNLSNSGNNLVNEIKSCNVLFISGSGTINTRHYFGMLRALLPIAMAIKLNKRVILSGQGFSPMKNKELENIVSYYLNKCEYIGYRDFNQGLEILNRIGIKKDILHSVCDDAYTLNPGNFQNLPEKSVAINVSCYGSKKVYNLLIEFADYLKLNGYNPIFNVFHFKDKETIEPYLKNKHTLVDFKNPKDAKAFFSKCIATVGMRYHSSILSLGAKTPVINIAMNEYQVEKFNSINKKDVIVPCLDGNTLTFDILKEKFNSLDKKIIEQTYNQWSCLAQKACKHVINSSNNNVLNLIKKRRSVRKFKAISIAEKDLFELVEAGTYAPSGSNTQCYRFKIITDKKDINFLADNKIKIVNNAPAIILVLSDKNDCHYLKGERNEIFKDLPIQDCAMAIQNICLLAESKNISQCVIQLSDTWPTASKIRQYFNLDNNYSFQGMILLGYSDEEIDYESAKHAGRFIKRKNVKDYLI